MRAAAAFSCVAAAHMPIPQAARDVQPSNFTTAGCLSDFSRKAHSPQLTPAFAHPPPPPRHHANPRAAQTRGPETCGVRCGVRQTLTCPLGFDGLATFDYAGSLTSIYNDHEDNGVMIFIDFTRWAVISTAVVKQL